MGAEDNGSNKMPQVLSKTPLRILHCVVGMNQGGYETLIMNLFRNLDRNKIQFDFISSQKGYFDNEILQLGGCIHYIPFITKCGPFLYASHLRTVLRNNPHYKIIHSHMDKFSGMVMREAKKVGIPVRISHAHNTQNEGGLLYQTVKDYYGKLINEHATDLMACSKPAAEWMFGYKSSEAVIINNGICLDKFKQCSETRRALRHEMNLEDRFVVGHVGRFEKQKNHVFLLDIFGELCKKEANARLVLVGKGDLRKKMEQKAKKMKVEDKIYFMGTRSDVEKVMQIFDVFVFPSLFEGLGICLVEAQAANLPCVISDDLPSEACLSKSIKKMSRTDSADKWADEILKIEKAEYDDKLLGLFDIEEVTKIMQQYYFSKKEVG